MPDIHSYSDKFFLRVLSIGVYVYEKISFSINYIFYESAHEILVLIALANSKDSEEPAHLHSVARAISAHIHKTYARHTCL